MVLRNFREKSDAQIHAKFTQSRYAKKILHDDKRITCQIKNIRVDFLKVILYVNL